MPASRRHPPSVRCWSSSWPWTSAFWRATVLAGVIGVVVVRRAAQEARRPVLVFLDRVGAGLAVVFGFGIVLITWVPLVLEVCP